MAEPNLYEPEWEVERDQPPLIGRTTRVGAKAGAERLGANLYEIDPGGVSSPFHLHHGNEELIIVIAGHPTLRTAERTRELRPGEIVACPVGRAGAHQLQNHQDVPVRVLLISTMDYPDVAELFDSDKILALSAPPGVDDRLFMAFPRRSAVDRLAGEIEEPHYRAGDSARGKESGHDPSGHC